jgi:hypothetical protein
MILTQRLHYAHPVWLPAQARGSREHPNRPEIMGFGLIGVCMLGFTLVANSLLPALHSASDEAAYLQYARNLLHGTYAVAAQQHEGLYLWHTPALPLILAPLLWLKVPLVLIRLIGPICLIATGGLLTLIMRRFVDRMVALASGLALCVYPPFWRLLPQLFVEPLALMLCLAGFEALLRCHERRQLRWAAISGLAFGYMVLGREEYGWLTTGLLVLAGLALIARRHRARVAPIALASLVTLLVCLPWLAYTYSKTHVLFYWSAASGESLYWMSSPGETGSWEQTQAVFTNPQLAGHRALFRRLDAMPQLQSDRELTRIAIRNIEQHPGVFVRHLIDNAGRMFVGIPFSFQAGDLSNLAFYGLPNIALLVGLAWSVWQLRRRHAALPRRLIPIVGFAAVSLIWHLPAAAFPRMATLSIPAFVVVIALGANARLASRRCRVPS